MEQSAQIQLYLPEGKPHVELLSPEGTVLAELHDRQTRQDLAASRFTDELKITWRWWEITHSQYHYKQPEILDLGEIG